MIESGRLGAVACPGTLVFRLTLCPSSHVPWLPPLTGTFNRKVPVNEETLSLLAMSSLLAQALNSFKSAAVAAHASALAPGQPAGGQGLEDFLVWIACVDRLCGSLVWIAGGAE